MWLTLFLSAYLAVAHGQGYRAPYTHQQEASYSAPHRNRGGYQSYVGDGGNYMPQQAAGSYQQQQQAYRGPAAEAGGYQAPYQPPRGAGAPHSYYGDSDGYHNLEQLSTGNPDDKEECSVNGQYLRHPEDACMYMLCVYTMYGWVHEEMPCPPGMGAARADEKLPPNSYPCVATRHSCKRKIIDEARYDDDAEDDESEVDGTARNTVSYMAPFSADEPISYDSSSSSSQQEQPASRHPRPRSTLIQDIIHGIDDQDKKQFVLQVPHDIPSAPTLSHPRERAHQETQAQEAPDQTYHGPPPARVQPEPKQRPRPRQRPSYQRGRNYQQQLHADQPQRVHRVLRVNKPGMKMVVEETEQMSEKNRPGYKMSKQSMQRTNMTKHRGDGRNGDMVMQQTSEYSEYSQTRSSNFRPDRPHRQARNYDAEFRPADDPQPGGYAPNFADTPRALALRAGPAYSRLPQKASFVHMPVIPSSLEEFFQNSFESLR